MGGRQKTEGRGRNTEDEKDRLLIMDYGLLVNEELIADFADYAE
jgi:hypothetical protein